MASSIPKGLVANDGNDRERWHRPFTKGTWEEALTTISFSLCFFKDGGKSLQEGMNENTTIRAMDLRLTDVGQENEYCINQLLKRNREDQYRQGQTS